MYKKLSKAMILLVLFLSTNISSAFLGDDLGFDLYKSIDEGLYDLELKNYEYELSGGGESISSEMNKVLSAKNIGECIKDGIDAESVEKIVGGDTKTLSSFISDDCYDEGDNISSEKLSDILSTVVEIDSVSRDVAEDKTKKTYEIARIGLYTDGSDENSPFDLINDLKEIDAIVFTREIEYDGEENYDLDLELDNFLDSSSDSSLSVYPSSSSSSSSSSNNNVNIVYSNSLSNQNNNSPLNNSNSGTDSNTGTELVLNNTYVCLENSNNSGLTGEQLNNIIVSINSSNAGGSGTNGGSNNSGNSGNNGGSSNNSSSNSSDDYDISDTGYESTNDDERFPCNDFFCIEVDFKTYNHELLGGGQTFSIEKIIKRSNEHLSEYAATSLVQSKMTKNNFELGLFNFSLPDMFHMGVQISKKSPPILNLSSDDDEGDEDDKEKKEFSHTNLLEKYYEANGLEYKRRNDILLYKQHAEQLKTVLDTAQIDANKVSDKASNLIAERDDIRKKFDYVSEAIDKTYIFEDMNYFYDQLIELERFIAGLNDYTTTFYGIVKGMKKIPVHN